MYINNYCHGSGRTSWEDAAQDVRPQQQRSADKAINDRRKWLVDAPLRVDERFVILPVQTSLGVYVVGAESMGPAKPGTFGRWQRFPMERFEASWLVQVASTEVGTTADGERLESLKTSDPVMHANSWLMSHQQLAVEIAREWQAEWRDRLDAEAETDTGHYLRAEAKPVRRKRSRLHPATQARIERAQEARRDAAIRRRKMRVRQLGKAQPPRWTRPSELGTGRVDLPAHVTGTVEEVPV